MLFRRGEIEGRKIVERPRESGSGETEGERQRFRDIGGQTEWKRKRGRDRGKETEGDRWWEAKGSIEGNIQRGEKKTKD
jgi:hypothetical protein